MARSRRGITSRAELNQLILLYREMVTLVLARQSSNQPASLQWRRVGVGVITYHAGDLVFDSRGIAGKCALRRKIVRHGSHCRPAHELSMTRRELSSELCALCRMSMMVLRIKYRRACVINPASAIAPESSRVALAAHVSPVGFVDERRFQSGQLTGMANSHTACWH